MQGERHMYRRKLPMDRQMMRRINQNLLLNLIRTHAPVSRSQLKHLSGLSLATIVGITAALIEEQLVVEIGVAESTGGRKAELLEIAPDGVFVVGIELREYEIIATLLNLHGKAVYATAWPAHLRNNAERAVDEVAVGVEAFIHHAPVSREKIIGLGCGVSGPVNTRTGICVDSWILNWHNVSLGRPLRERLKMPVFVDNAVNCLASYEKLYGDGQKYHDFLLVTLGRGLGLAVVLHDDIFRGAQGIGAEFGHIPFDVDGRLCECGNRGCLEAYVSDHGIVASYREQLAELVSTNSASIHENPNIFTIRHFFSHVLAGNVPALKTLERTGKYLGIGLATLVNLFNPECIIVHSDEGYQVDLMLPSFKETMNQHIFSQLGRNLEVIIEEPTLKENWARGAGCLVLRDFFSSPAQL